jgi:spermidine synthase
MRSARLQAVVSDGCSFTAGLATALVQVVLVRELFGVLEGHEVSVALSLAVWVAGIAGGSLLGARLAARARIDAGRLVLLAALLAVAAFVGLALLRDARALLDVPRGAAVGPGGSLLAAVLGVLPAAVVAGAFLPLYARASAGPAGLACGPARFYALDAAGMALGGVLAPFVVGTAPAPRLVALFAALAAAAPAVAASVGLVRPGRTGGALGALGLLLLAVLALWSDGFEAVTQARRRAALGVAGVVVRTVETPYQRLDVARAPGQVAILGNGAVAALAPDPYGAGAVLDGLLLQHPAPRTVLVVGSSPPDAVRLALAHGARTVTLATLDPQVLTELRAALAPAEAAWLGRAAVAPVDARAHLRSVRAATYDLIVWFPPEPSTTLANRFYTREAFAEAARALAPGGVLALRLPWSANAPDRATRAYGRSVANALREALPQLVVRPGLDVVLLASRRPGVATAEPGALAARAAARPGLAGRAYPPGLFAAEFPPDRMAELAAQLGLERPAAGPVNADLRPVAYLERLLALLARRSTGLASRGAEGPARLLRAAAAIPPWVGAALLLLVPLAAWRLRRRPRTLAGTEALVLAAFVGGTGMALQLLLLVAYQVRTGRLYVGYALLSGAFMLGLAAGARLGERLGERRGWDPREALARCETCAALLLLAVWAAASWLTAASWALVPLAAVAGGLTGLPFAALVGLAGVARPGAARAGGWAAAGDNLGACVGALAATLVLLPAHGFGTAVLLLAAARACGAATAAARA